MQKIDNIEKLKNYRPYKEFPFNRIKKIYDIKKGDNVLIYCDEGRKSSNEKISARTNVSPRLGKTLYNKLKEMNCNVSIIVGKELRNIKFCSNKLNDVVHSLGVGDLFISLSSGLVPYFHKNGKRVVTRKLMDKNGFKIMSTNGLASLKPSKVSKFFNSYMHDEKQIKKLNDKLVKLFANAKEAMVTCPLGTDLKVKFGNRKVISNDGSLKKGFPDTNYPVGEVYTPPLESSAEGIAYVKSSKVVGDTILNKKPKKYVFEKGLLIYTELEELRKRLKQVEKFNKKVGLKEWKTAPYRMAEFAIGTNKKAELIGLMINDEKAYATCHFAIGANTHFGGKTKCNGHMDHVIEKPSVWIDSTQILEKGKFLI